MMIDGWWSRPHQIRDEEYPRDFRKNILGNNSRRSLVGLSTAAELSGRMWLELASMQLITEVFLLPGSDSCLGKKNLKLVRRNW